MPFRDLAAKRAYQRDWVAARRREWLTGKSCAYCASTDDLHFHHFDPFDKVDHRVWSWSPAKRDAELAKCIVLCRGCHQDHHRAADRQRFCKNGHEFTDANTYVKPSTGRRECVTCKKARSKKAA
jgi:hypothetical protein